MFPAELLEGLEGLMCDVGHSAEGKTSGQAAAKTG